MYSAPVPHVKFEQLFWAVAISNSLIVAIQLLSSIVFIDNLKKKFKSQTFSQINRHL